MAATRNGFLTGFWISLVILGVLLVSPASTAPVLQDENVEVKLLSSTVSPFPGGGDEEKTGEIHK